VGYVPFSIFLVVTVTNYEPVRTTIIKSIIRVVNRKPFLKVFRQLKADCNTSFLSGFSDEIYFSLTNKKPAGNEVSQQVKF